MRKDATGAKQESVGMARTRALLTKALSTSLTAPESNYLSSELGRLADGVARVNARLGRQAVELSPYAKLASDAGASAVMTV